MSEVTITVRGEHEQRIAPERATVRLSVRAEGAERASVVDEALRLAAPVRDGIEKRSDAGTVVDWSSSSLSVRAERPWNAEGRRLAPVHYAAVEFTVTFAEASELSLWVSDASAWDGVELTGVRWHLTPQTRAVAEREVAASAVADAVTRAEAYASALGLSTVEAVEIADVGLLADHRESAGAPMLMRAAKLDASGPGMEYEPEDIIVSATVEARFLAR